MNDQTGGEAESLDRPDITLFDLGLGFDPADSTQPITIVEFKRPKRDDYTVTENPISQVRDYTDQLRKAGVATKFDGAHLRTIDENTPFMCQIVADITPSLLKVMRQLGEFHRKAGTGSYYRWDENFRVFIEISSFDEILKSAKARNQVFFERLGID
jgi:hypothetical protein